MKEDDDSASPSPARRQRAPTITIDTSAVSGNSPPQSMDHEALPLRPITSSAPSSPTMTDTNSQQPTVSRANSQSGGPFAPELRASNSFDSRESRPTSPHNVSSPTTTSRGVNERAGPAAHGFLSVPGLRSRQNSVDSDEDYHSGQSARSLSGETYIPTQSGSSTQGDGNGNNKDLAMQNSHRNYEVMNDADALSPDPGTEEDFVVQDNKFAFSQGQLNKLINPKSLSAFYALGGLAGLEKGLRTDRRAGLSADEQKLDGVVDFKDVGGKDVKAAETSQPVLSRAQTSASTKKRFEGAFSDRKRIFNDNRLPVKKGKNIFQLMWVTYNDKVLILLSVAAVVSLAIGLYQTFGTVHDPDNPPIEWVEGVAIIIAIVVVVVVGSLNDFQKERQFTKLNAKKQDRIVNIIRSGKSQEVSIFDILVGDVVHLEPGDMIPVDGIFIEGYNVKCDESQTTGESDLIRKRPADDVYEAISSNQELRKMDPFILSGAQVTEGVGTFLCTSTGVNSSYGKTMMSLREDPEVTPLQSKLNTLAEYIAKLGGAAGLILFLTLFIEFLARLPHNHESPANKGQDFLNIFIVTVTIIVVAVPEGLPLAVTLALAFATTRMLKDNNLVRHLKACEVMGNATAICSDKTGTLTQNKMMVVAGTLGTNSSFGAGAGPAKTATSTQDGAAAPDNSNNVTATEVVKSLGNTVKELLVHSLVINSTAFEGDVDGVKTFIGSKTETALLIFARDLLNVGPVTQERDSVKVVQLVPFDSARKCMGVVIQLENGTYRLFVKGASEILLAQCTSIIRDPTMDASSTSMSADDRETTNNLITTYASRSLRTIGLLYRDFERWPPKGVRTAEGDRNEAVFEDVFKNMTFLGLVGIQDPLRDGVRAAVETCQKAGVVVRMVTGDNLMTAKAIAEDCGIYTAGGLVMEGPVFRKLSKAQMEQTIPRLQVLARSSPEDKRKLVQRLKDLGETVAVTGDGTNDAPALKTADVGFSMGIAGTEVAKEASAIILMDDNFASIVKAMMWGRAVNDAVRKFLQFQVTVNITAVLLTFISAVASKDEESVLTAVQLLWVNLIMDTMAALALATDPPTPSILDRKPDPKSANLISVTMWKMIIGEAVYQLIVTLILHFGSKQIFGYTSADEISTLVFNVFVWMQIFNQWNNRRLDNKFNIFEGVFNNWFFMGINLVMVGAQTLIVFVGGAAFSVTPLNGDQWAISIVLGFLSIPIGALIRLIPDEFLARMYPEFLKRRSSSSSTNGPELTVSDEEEQFRFPKPLADVREELSFLKKVKGGRLNNLKFAIANPRETFLPRSRSGSRSRASSLPQTPVTGSKTDREDGGFGPPQRQSPAPPPTPDSRRRSRSARSRSNSALGATTVMAGIIAGSVAGWSPIDRAQQQQQQQQEDSNNGSNESSSSSSAAMRLSAAHGRQQLEAREGVEVHPDTRADDQVIAENPAAMDGPPSQVPALNPAVGGGGGGGGK